MVEEEQGVGSKRPLIIAGVLALVVVVLYNIHVSRIRSAAEGDTTAVVRYTRALQAGRKLRARDVEVVEINRRLAKQLGPLVKGDEKAELVGMALRFDVPAGGLALWGHLAGAGTNGDDRLALGETQASTIEVDPDTTPGELLQPGDRVNLVGLVQPPGKPLQAYTLLYAAPVLSVGGVSQEQLEQRGYAGSRRRYSKITLRLRPDVDQQLRNLLTHLRGEGKPDVVIAGDVPANLVGKINPLLAALAKEASAGAGPAPGLGDGL